MARKLRSRYFIATGAAGGLFGFALMELLGAPAGATGSAPGNVLRMAFYFGGYGLAVGAFLGMTEGLSRPAGFGSGLLSRLLADSVVGTCTGGSMRLVEERFVDAFPRTNRISDRLPRKEDRTPGSPRNPLNHLEKSVSKKPKKTLTRVRDLKKSPVPKREAHNQRRRSRWQ